MSYDTIQEFTLAYNASAGTFGGVRALGAAQAYIIYQRTKATPLGLCVLGRHINEAHGGAVGIQWFEAGLTVTGASPTGVGGTSDHVAQNFGLVAEHGNDVLISDGVYGSAFIGSILAAGGWDLSVNDAWLLAGVHGFLPFYCASPMSAGNLLDAHYGITITGREVAGLLAFGYRIEDNTALGEVFTCRNQPLASDASFATYNALIAGMPTMGAARAFFQQYGLCN